MVVAVVVDAREAGVAVVVVLVVLMVVVVSVVAVVVVAAAAARRLQYQKSPYRHRKSIHNDAVLCRHEILEGMGVAVESVLS